MTDYTGKFSGKAENYAKYRPSYPRELIDYLYDNTHAAAVADIGAGTGIFTHCLEAKPWKISAVEPNDDMRGKLTETVGRDVTIYAAPAEHTGIPSGSVGLVTVAQAFHWFDPNLFRDECFRINPEGILAVVWNGRTSCDFSVARDDVCRKYCEAFRTGHVGGTMSDIDGHEFFRESYYDTLEFTEYENNVLVTLEGFIGDTLSRSYAPKKDDECYEDFIKELSECFARFEKNGTAVMPYETTCYFGSLKGKKL